MVAPGIAVGRDSAVHVAYYDLLDDRRDYQGLEGPVWEGQWSVVVSTSTDGGTTFSRHVEGAGGVQPTERVMLIYTMASPAIAADGDGGVWVAWPDARSGDWDVLVVGSSDGARSFRAPVRMNDDPEGNGRHQYLPRLASPSEGRVDAIFYDRCEDPANLSNHVYYASSTDGGLTFRPNTRLTSEPSYTRTGISYLVPSARGLIEFGSRLGLASTRDGVLAAWTDTRNVRFGSTHQDVFATKIVTGEPRSSEPAPIGLAVAGGVALTAVLGNGADSAGPPSPEAGGLTGSMLPRRGLPANLRRWYGLRPFGSRLSRARSWTYRAIAGAARRTGGCRAIKNAAAPNRSRSGGTTPAREDEPWRGPRAPESESPERRWRQLTLAWGLLVAP
ncbi:MAG: sialidase family protein [Acidimicrobiales bacterium]